MDLKPFHRINYNVNSKITTLSVFGSLYCLIGNYKNAMRKIQSVSREWMSR